MNEAEKRLHRVCFTGHRPEKLTRSEDEVKHDLEQEIRQAIYDCFYVFISGMARGVDLWAAEIVLKLKQEFPSIKLICVSPYQGFESRWSQQDQALYRTILSHADYVKFVCSGYSRSCFQVRNEWLVNHASRVIAVFNGQNSGTKNTINYAIKVHVPVVHIKG